jgi:hypothetical protein
MEIWISKRFLQDGEFVEGNDSSALAVEPRMAKKMGGIQSFPKVLLCECRQGGF